MTAMNIIVQAKAGAAYLLTDTAHFNPDGTVGQFAPKVLSLRAAGRFSAAIATSGIAVQRNHFKKHLAELKPRSTSDLLSSIGPMFRITEQEIMAQGVPSVCGTSHMSAVVALFDHETNEASGYAISNQNSCFPTGKYRPYTLAPILKYLTRYKGQPFPRGTDMCDPRKWDAVASAPALVEAQRIDDFGLADDLRAGVGGQAILTCVNEEGISHKIVAAWADRIGERIDRSQDDNPSFTGRLRRCRRLAMLPIMPRLGFGPFVEQEKSRG